MVLIEFVFKILQNNYILLRVILHFNTHLSKAIILFIFLLCRKCKEIQKTCSGPLSSRCFAVSYNCYLLSDEMYWTQYAWCIQVCQIKEIYHCTKLQLYGTTSRIWTQLERRNYQEMYSTRHYSWIELFLIQKTFGNIFQRAEISFMTNLVPLMYFILKLYCDIDFVWK